MHICYFVRPNFKTCDADTTIPASRELGECRASLCHWRQRYELGAELSTCYEYCSSDSLPIVEMEY
jgi:hypothetical protein